MPVIEFREGLRQHPASRRIVPAVQPDFGLCGHKGPKRALPEFLQAGGPCGGLEAFGYVPVADAGVVEAADGGNGIAGIVDLVAAFQLRQRQVQKPALVLEHHAAMLLEDLPVLPGDVKLGPHPLAHALDRGAGLVRLGADDGRAARASGCRPSRPRSG